MNNSKGKYDNNVAYKFVLYKIKKLVCDSRGKPKYMTNFDKIINEIFATNHFSKKLSQIYDNRDFAAHLDKIGMDILMEIMQSAKLYHALEDLITINYRMDELRNVIRKQAKKGKRDKYTIKEYNYLNNLHKDAIKIFRKRFGIKNAKNAYKRRYKSLTSLVETKKNKYDDGSFSSILFNTDPFYDDFDDEDDDDFDDFDSEYEYKYGRKRINDEYEETSELEDFVNMLSGTPTRKGKPSRKRASSRPIKKSLYDLDDYDLEDDDDDDFEDELELRKRKKMDYSIINPDLEERVDLIATAVQDLASGVQSVLMRDEYERTTGIRKQAIEVNDYIKELEAANKKLSQGQPAETPVFDPTTGTTTTPVSTDLMSKISLQLEKVSEDNNVCKEALGYLIKQYNDLADTVDELIEYEDDESDAVEVVMDTPRIIGGINLDKYPDVYEEIAKEEAMEAAQANRKASTNVNNISREELVDLINQSGEDASTVKPKVVTTLSTQPEVDEQPLASEAGPKPGEAID